MKNILYLIAAVLLVSCQTSTSIGSNSEVGIDSLTVERVLKTLASDEYAGRKPFTEGEVKTVNYLEGEFKKLGLMPGNGDSYFQDVPMVEITGMPSDEMVIAGGASEVKLKVKDEFVALTEREVEQVAPCITY